MMLAPLPRLPLEIIFSISDLLHNDTETLAQCCLVFKAWIHHTRRHLFNEIEFPYPSKLEAWKETFPDPAGSPAHYARVLRIRCANVATTKDAEEGGWIRSFTNVTQLELWGMHTPLDPFYILSSVKSLRVLFVTSPEVLRLVCSFPLLEDLDICIAEMNDFDWATFKPPTLPRPLTGTLVHKGGMHAARLLLGLPDGLRFRKIEWETSFSEGELELVMDLMEKCSQTLEGIFVKTSWSSPTQGRPPLDLSKAKTLKEVAFSFEVNRHNHTEWVNATLSTISSGHKDLQRVSIHATLVGEATRQELIKLEETLSHISKLHAVFTKVECAYVDDWQPGRISTS